ncbi:inositol monophosphatase [Catenulispora acidiphila DSM 44928]|uniref:inositol-phosphate phosphatase n=1 Tax=Catenulispora acidiphila (strain DSM 44928 / JCM 14897 / NBRC 102108 / NRRL B-24433 / ID139908) TaxID=479433 RepID=C7Q6S9_CATAD|nr:inositol monophosphatase [Catenulispora acidiphila]ACU75942.1 inositol monophosphatase [Catenulispora acidiphila DSM 44928]
MISFAELAEVEDIIRSVNEKTVLPRFRALRDSDVVMKGPNDPVTVADREAEDQLRERLTAFLPGSVVVGEEAVSEDASVLAALTGSAPVWIVDPIDGTRNFVAGSGRFSTLVALSVGGVLLASWTYAPVLGRIGTALAGHGAQVDGVPVRVAAAPADGTPTLPVTTSHPVWWPNGYGRGVDAMRAADLDVRYFDACGIEYLDLAAGSRSAMVITWEFCWDHAAGLLLVAEAGGHVAALDGAPVRLEGGNVLPFVASTDQATTDRIRTLIVESK